MPQSLQSSFPDIDLGPGMQIVFEAVDPTTGDPVSGVTVSAITIYPEGASAAEPAGSFGPFMFVPGPGA